MHTSMAESAQIFSMDSGTHHVDWVTVEESLEGFVVLLDTIW